jgi:hypothetical protein
VTPAAAVNPPAGAPAAVTTAAPAPLSASAVTPEQGTCCDSAKVTEEMARNRSITLHFCRTLVEWGDACRRRGHSPEAFAQARLAYDTVAKIMGPRPSADRAGRERDVS